MWSIRTSLSCWFNYMTRDKNEFCFRSCSKIPLAWAFFDVGVFISSSSSSVWGGNLRCVTVFPRFVPGCRFVVDCFVFSVSVSAEYSLVPQRYHSEEFYSTFASIPHHIRHSMWLEVGHPIFNMWLCPRGLGLVICELKNGELVKCELEVRTASANFCKKLRRS